MKAPQIDISRKCHSEKVEKPWQTVVQNGNASYSANKRGTSKCPKPILSVIFCD